MKKFQLLLFFSLFLVSLSSMELRVSSIIFEGNNLINDRELLSVIRTRIQVLYDQQTAIDDCHRIAEHYSLKGFNSVTVSYPEAIPVSPTDVSVHFYISEHKEIRVNRIILRGNSYIREDRLLQETGFSAGRDYPLDMLNRFQTALIDFYASRGFLFAKTHLDSVAVNNHINDIDNGNQDYEYVTAYITVSEGRYCRFERFLFEGNVITKDKTLMRISGLDRMELFSLENLHFAEENVRRKEYIRDFSLTPLDSRTLLLNTEEDRMTYIYGMLGYDNSQAEGAGKITGFINFRFLNLYGTDRSLAFYWSRLRADRQSIEFVYFESGPFDYPIAGELSLYRESVDSTHIMTSIESDIYYYNLRNKIGLYIGSEDIIPGSRRPMLIEKMSYKKLGLFWEYNSEDYHLNPTQGINFSVRHYYIFHREKGSWYNKQATEMSLQQYFQLSGHTAAMKPIVLMTSLNGKQIENKNLQDYEKYTLGGINDLRGFREGQFTGYRVLWSNLEIRYLLSRRSRFFVFIDYGYVQLSETRLSINDLLGLGFGVRLDTRIGLIGLDYGFSHNKGVWMHPLDGMVHFGVHTGF